MKTIKNNPLIAIKLLAAALAAVLLASFFLPFNAFFAEKKSMLTVILSFFKGDFIQPCPRRVLFFVGGIAVAGCAAAAAAGFFMKTAETVRKFCLPLYLSAAVVFGFCFGALIDLEGLSASLHSFGFVGLAASTLICAAILRLDFAKADIKEL